MPGGGTRTFLEPDQYEASLGQAQIAAVIVPRGKFRARLIWAELHHLQVLRCEEDSPRIAYVQLAPGLTFVSLSADSESSWVFCGREVQAGGIVFHSRGERLHQSTPGPIVWSVIAIDPAQLEHYGRALSGRPSFLPTKGRTLQLSRHLAAGLRRQHVRICRPRLAETKPKILSHSEVARAIEQGLIQTLVTCLTTARAVTHGYAKRRHARIMVRFEEVLAEHLSRPLQMPELCALVAVSDYTLRAAGCVTPILTTQTSQKLPIASVSPSWRASARRTKRHFWRGPIDHSPTRYPNATLGSVNFPHFCIVGEESESLASGPLLQY